MISCNSLGSNGRLGNQIFQYAAIKGIAYNNNVEFCIPAKDKHQLFECFNMSNTLVLKETKSPILKERYFNFDLELFNDIPKEIDLYGYWQSEKYFLNVKEDLIKELTFKEEILNSANNILKKINKKLISIHVRRGDYVNLQHYHGLCTLEYYRNAIKSFDDSYSFLIFSDDIEWCKKKFIGERFIFSENNNQYVDLCLMTLCEHNIIANSSFSWWAGWLNKNVEKKVIAPKKWFEKNINTEDLYCLNWIIL